MKTKGKSVLVLPEKNPEKTNRGILIPKTAAQMRPIGTVIACGNNCDDVKEGDRIQYNPKNGSIMTIKGVDHHFIQEPYIYYIYGKNNGK